MSKTGEQTVRVLDEAYKTIRSGAPGLSDQTCNVLAGIIARKVSIVYAQPHPSQQAGAEEAFVDAEARAEAWSDRIEIQDMIANTTEVFAAWASPEILSRFRQQMAGVIQQAFIEGVADEADRLAALKPVEG